MSNIRPTDAETVDGLDAAEIGRSNAELQEQALAVQFVMGGFFNA